MTMSPPDHANRTADRSAGIIPASEEAADDPDALIGSDGDIVKGRPKKLKMAIRYAIGLLILFAVSRQVTRTWSNWRVQSDLFEVSYGPMLAAVAAYVGGLVAFGFYYGVIVRNVRPSLGHLPSLRAYLLSHPAKYVPGKAMVVVVRIAILGREGVGPAAASFTAIFETLSMMALGGLLGAILLILPGGHRLGATLSLGMGVAFLATVLPWTFGKAVRILKKGVPKIDPADCPRPGSREVLKLTILGTGGWLAWGISGVLVVSALSGGNLRPLEEWPRIAGAVMVGTAGGFALPLLPGGLGLREGIYAEVTKGVLGPDLAIASALALRFVWVVGEVIAVAAISLIPEPRVELPNSNGPCDA
jgi:hypothetical protein